MTKQYTREEIEALLNLEVNAVNMGYIAAKAGPIILQLLDQIKILEEGLGFYATLGDFQRADSNIACSASEMIENDNFGDLARETLEKARGGK